jgi:hypothetical protein
LKIVFENRYRPALLALVVKIYPFKNKINKIYFQGFDQVLEMMPSFKTRIIQRISHGITILIFSVLSTLFIHRGLLLEKFDVSLVHFSKFPNTSYSFACPSFRVF